MAETVLKRQTGRAHTAALVSADVASVPGKLVISGTSLAGSEVLRVIGDQQLDGLLRGPDDGTGIIIGHVGASSNTGSVLQVQTFTTTQRDFLSAAAGMLIYNSTGTKLEFREGSAWNRFATLDSLGLLTTSEAPPRLRDFIERRPKRQFLGMLLDYPSAGTVTASEIQYTRIWLYANQVITGVEIFPTANINTGDNARVGLYDQTTPTSDVGVPVSRVAQSNSTQVGSANAYQAISFTANYTVPTAGYYWIAVISDNAGSLLADPSFAVSSTYRANFLPIRREAGSGTTLPATAANLNNPASAVMYAAAVEQ